MYGKIYSTSDESALKSFSRVGKNGSGSQALGVFELVKGYLVGDPLKHKAWSRQATEPGAVAVARISDISSFCLKAEWTWIPPTKLCEEALFAGPHLIY